MILPSLSTAIRSQIVFRLSRSCVTMKTAIADVRCKVRISWSKSPALIGSSPEVGSSQKKNLGIERQRPRKRDAFDHAARKLRRNLR